MRQLLTRTNKPPIEAQSPVVLEGLMLQMPMLVPIFMLSLMERQYLEQGIDMLIQLRRT